jgi:putative ABC transport system ATP-binding protein
MLIPDLAFSLEGKSLPDLFNARVSVDPDRIAACHHEGELLHQVTRLELFQRSGALAARFVDLGLRADSIVGVFLPTSYLWMLVDLTCLRFGWVSAVYHVGWQSEELAHAISLRPPQFVVCSKSMRPLVVQAVQARQLNVKVIEIEDLIDHQGLDEGEFFPIRSPKPDAVATISFTSGSVEYAKPIALTHRALLESAWHSYSMLGFDGAGQHTLHWLPLSHVFGRIGLYIDWVAGCTGFYSRGVEFLAQDLLVARPAVLFTVPKGLTRFRSRIESRVQSKPRALRFVFHLLQKLTGFTLRLPVPIRLKCQKFVRRFVFPSVHKPLGGRLAVLIVGGAPVDEKDKCYFESIGIAVREGFGMTETAGVAAVQPLRKHSVGAGCLLPSVRARIADDGELLLQGSSLLSPQWNAEMYDQDGWFHTGDIAEISEAGDLRILGRLKDIIIPESGENVSPARIEALVCRHPWIDDVCLIGDRRPCLIALLMLSAEGLEAIGKAEGSLFDAEIKTHLEKINTLLPRFERVYGHVVLPKGFSVTGGELTVTNKKRRLFIMDKYQQEIDACYAAHRQGAEIISIASANRSTLSLDGVRMGSHNQQLIQVEGLHYRYNGSDGPVDVLRNISLEVRQGEFLSILGPSGGGKSTLLNLLGALDRPTEGRVWVNGKDLTAMDAKALEHYRQTDIAFIFQFFNLLPTLTALENVLLAMEAMEHPPQDAHERACRFLSRVGLEEKMDRFPSQLSGGEQQRVAIARALSKGAPLILADEPTGNLDEETAAAVMDLIVEAQGESGATLLLITHDLSVARRAGRTVELVKGGLKEVHFGDVGHAAHRSKVF